MKRILALLVSICIIFSILTVAASADETSDITLTYSLSSNEQKSITAKTNDIVTVLFAVKRTDSSDSFNFNAVQDEIIYDQNFFEYVDGSAALVNSSDNRSVECQTRVNGVNVIKASDISGSYTADTDFCTFELKIVATSGSGKVENSEALAYDSTGKIISITSEDMTVTISSVGSGTVSGTTKYTLSFNSNGGSSITSVSQSRGSAVNLDKYVPEREGYTFTGWYSDSALTNKVTSITLNSNTTVYAGWKKTEDEWEVDNLETETHMAYIDGYEDGSVHPNASITRAETAAIFYKLLTDEALNNYQTGKNSFTDVPEGSWYNAAVSTLAAMGILNGYEDGSFKPDGLMTRAELTAIAERFAVKNNTESVSFSDIEGHWAEKDIKLAEANGWIDGYEDNSFKPDENVTKAETMAVVNRVLRRQPEDISDLLPGMKTWSDNADTSAWYYIDVQEASNSHEYQMKDDGIHEKWSALD